MANITIKRALISVFDKTGVVDLAKTLADNGVEILSTGGTYKLLCEQFEYDMYPYSCSTYTNDPNYFVYR